MNWGNFYNLLSECLIFDIEKTRRGICANTELSIHFVEYMSGERKPDTFNIQ